MIKRKFIVSAIVVFAGLSLAGQALAYEKTIDGKPYNCTKTTGTQCTYDDAGNQLGCSSWTVESCFPKAEPKKPAALDPGPAPNPPKKPKGSGFIGKHTGFSFGG